MSLLFNYWTSITKNESPSKIFDWKIYLYGFLSTFIMMCKSSSTREKPPHNVEAICFVNTILSHVDQLGRLDCKDCDEV